MTDWKLCKYFKQFKWQGQVSDLIITNLIFEISSNNFEIQSVIQKETSRG